jgi:lipoprotein-anchoring transpeptidase ErfK/SrfK
MQSIGKAIETAGRKAALAAIAVMMAVEAAEAQQQSQAGSSQPAVTRDVVVLVSIPDRKLALIENGKVTRIFPVAVGKESTPSPTGEFTVVTRVVAPTYYHPGVVIPAGPQNPLGTRWIGLSQKGLGIHGTNEPRSIGKAASHGCIRMRRADLEQLFAVLRPADPVLIRGERDAQVAQIFGGEPSAIITADAAAAPASSAPSGN